MVTDRRHLAVLGALGLASVATNSATARPSRKRQIVHHVLFWLKNPSDASNLDELIAGLETLRAIPEIREFRIGLPAATEARSVVDGSYSVSELLILDTLEDQRRYQEHPIHQQFVKTCEHLWDRVVVYDCIDV